MEKTQIRSKFRVKETPKMIDHPNNRFALSEVGDESIQCPKSPNFYNFEVWTWIFEEKYSPEALRRLDEYLDDSIAHQEPKWSSG